MFVGDVFFNKGRRLEQLGASFTSKFTLILLLDVLFHTSRELTRAAQVSITQ